MRLLYVLMIALWPGLLGAQEPPHPSITVNGIGEVTSSPDMATLTLGVTAEAASARTAMSEVSANTAAILEVLQAGGVAEADIQTRDLRLNPLWSNASSVRQRKITGYQASNMVLVRARDLDGLGALLDRVIESGATDFNGLSFGLQDPEPLMDEARRLAVAEARRKAELYAEAAGVALGPLITLNEAGGGSPRPVMMEMARAASAAVPIAGGELTIAANVVLAYEIAE